MKYCPAQPPRLGGRPSGTPKPLEPHGPRRRGSWPSGLGARSSAYAQGAWEGGGGSSGGASDSATPSVASSTRWRTASAVIPEQVTQRGGKWPWLGKAGGAWSLGASASGVGGG